MNPTPTPEGEIESMLQSLALHFAGKNEGYLQCIHAIGEYIRSLRSERDGYREGNAEAVHEFIGKFYNRLLERHSHHRPPTMPEVLFHADELHKELYINFPSSKSTIL